MDELKLILDWIDPAGRNMKTSKTHPIRLDLVNSDDYPELNRLGMTLAPGKKVLTAGKTDWNRDLALDLGRLKILYKVNALVSLVENDELERLGMEEISDECGKLGIELIRFPLKDGSTPESAEDFIPLIKAIIDRLGDDEIIAVHCRGGLGRTGLTVACAIVAISAGMLDGKRAIEMTRLARPGTIETSGQEDFVLRFENHWRSTKS